MERNNRPIAGDIYGRCLRSTTMNQGDTPIWGQPQMGNQAIGDTLRLPKDPTITRIHFQNVNGVSLGKDGTWEGVCEKWKNMEVDIGLICEHKLDTTSYNAKHSHQTQRRSIATIRNGSFPNESCIHPSRAWKTL